MTDVKNKVLPYFCVCIFFRKRIEQAVDQFAKLPGVGRKSALRLTLHLLKMDKSEVHDFGQSFIDLINNINYCSQCHNISEMDVADCVLTQIETAKRCVW